MSGHLLDAERVAKLPRHPAKFEADIEAQSYTNLPNDLPATTTIKLHVIYTDLHSLASLDLGYLRLLSNPSSDG